MFIHKDCPGPIKEDFKQSVACRLLLLGDGSIVQQVLQLHYMYSNKHCEVLVSCSGREVDNFRNLQEPSVTFRNLQEPSEIEFSIIVV